MEELVPLTKDRPWKITTEAKADGTMRVTVEILLPVGEFAEFPDNEKIKRAMTRLSEGLVRAWKS